MDEREGRCVLCRTRSLRWAGDKDAMGIAISTDSCPCPQGGTAQEWLCHCPSGSSPALNRWTLEEPGGRGEEWLE